MKLIMIIMINYIFKFQIPTSQHKYCQIKWLSTKSKATFQGKHSKLKSQCILEKVQCQSIALSKPAWIA